MALSAIKTICYDNYMITGRQIRAARSLLEWKAEDLANEAGLTRVTISKIESDLVQAQEKSIVAIIAAFDRHGIEFTDFDGVRRKPSNIEIFIGVDRFNAFYEFLYQNLKTYGGDVCIAAVDEGLFSKYRKDPDQHRKYMKELVDSGAITVRILASESKFSSSYAQFKRLPKANYAPTSFYAFGNCLALITFEYDPAPYVVLHKASPFAEAYRQSFNLMWATAEAPPKGAP